MRATRLLSILMMLQVRERVTAESLAKELGVSVRTIYRDIEELGAMGIPLSSEGGPGGGYQLVGGYRTRLTGLGMAEAEALLLLGLPGPAAQLGLGRAVLDAERKVLASLPKEQVGQAARIGARFHLDPVDWYRNVEPVPHLPAIARAVLDQTAIEVTYRSWRRIRRWTLEPLGLVLKAGAWYMVARSERDPTVFKIAEVLELTVLERTFVRPPAFSLPEFWTAAQARFEQALRPQRAQLLASERVLGRLRELGRFAAEAVAAAVREPSGDFCVSWPIESVAHAAHQLLAMGPEVEVLEPPELRAALHDAAAAVARRHRPRKARSAAEPRKARAGATRGNNRRLRGVPYTCRCRAFAIPSPGWQRRGGFSSRSSAPW